MVRRRGGEVPAPVRIFSSSAEGVSEMTWPPTGSVGLTISALSPTGEVHVGGSVYPARVRGGSIAERSRVVVTGFDPFGLIVREFVLSDAGPTKEPPTLENLLSAEVQRREAAVASGRV